MAYSLTTTKSWSDTERDLKECFRRWGVSDKQFEITAQLSGASAASWQLNNTPAKREVLVTFTHPSTGVVVPVKSSSQARAVDNFRVCYLALDAIRLNEARGVADVVQQVYMALPAPAVVRDPYEVLGVRSDTDQAVVEASYKAMRRKYHPDNQESGDADRFKELEVAYEAIKKERGS